MSIDEPDQKEWIATLVGRLLDAKHTTRVLGKIVCPICDCDHQVYQGMGIVAPDETSPKLVCAFPTTETIVKIDLPPDVKVGGLTLYTRYLCVCGGHHWALVTAFRTDGTTAWCVSLSSKPDGQKKSKIASAPSESDMDHEHPLARLPDIVRFLWVSWRRRRTLNAKPIPNSLPDLPPKPAATCVPPHMACGLNNSEHFAARHKFLFALAVDVKKETHDNIYAFIYWESALLVVSLAKDHASIVRQAEDITATIAEMNSLTPEVFMLNQGDYEALQRMLGKAAQPKSKS